LKIEDWKLKIGNVQSFTPHSALRTPQSSRGFTYVALLAVIAIIGISLGSAGKYWQNVKQRDNEEELLFRGDQYRKAIERYYFAIPGRPQYPESIDTLLKDSRTPTGKRHLRQKFKDPLTGEDFVELRDQLSKRIIGVHSSSDKNPLKQSNFSESDAEFEGKEKYSEWNFVFVAKTGQPASPVRQQNPGQPAVPAPHQ